jgi:DNA recombination protein RmuC
MEIITIALLVVSVVVLLFVYRQMQQVKSDMQTQIHQMKQDFSARLDSNSQTLSSNLGTINNQVSNTTNVIAQVQGDLGQMKESTRHIMELARDIKSLQNILQSPKMRGGLGEFLLEDLLSQCLQADSFRIQHSFGRGTVVDAALFIGQRILCVDSKFPLENFKRMFSTDAEVEKKALRKTFLSDVKKHINDISERYINPDENTFDFALMFIPAENVYYELIVREDSQLYEHCLTRKVIPVSPNTFYAYLQVILMGLRGLQISDQAKEILAQLQQLENDMARFENDFSKIGGHIRDAQSSYQKSDERLQRLKRKIANMETPELEKELQLFSASENKKTGS